MDIVAAYGRWADSRWAKRDAAYGEQTTFRASSMGTCHRRQIMQLAGLEGRPMTDEKRRFLHSRTLLHDDFVRAMRHEGLAVATEFSVSRGLPEGFSGHGDLLLHDGAECGCDMAGKGHLQITFARAMKALCAGNRAEADMLFRHLRDHSFELTDVKTTHPNLVNYSHNLPRAHNCQQVRTYGMGLRKQAGIQARLSVTYLPMGEGRPMRYEVEPDEAAVAQEMNLLQTEWALFQEAGQLPAPLPLELKDRKEGPHRVIFEVPAWECSEQYCAYCRNEGGASCEPLATQNQTGDRLAYLNPDGTHTFVEKWLRKLGRPVPPGASVEEGPRPKAEAA